MAERATRREAPTNPDSLLLNPASRLRSWVTDLRALAADEIMSALSRRLVSDLADSLAGDARIIDARLQPLLGLSEWQRAALHRLAAAHQADPVARGVPRPKGVQGTTLEVLVALGAAVLVDEPRTRGGVGYALTELGWLAAEYLPRERA